MRSHKRVCYVFTLDIVASGDNFLVPKKAPKGNARRCEIFISSISRLQTDNRKKKTNNNKSAFNY